MNRIDEYIATGLKGMRQAAAIFLFSALLALLVNALRPGGLAWFGDWTPEAQPTLETGENLIISLQEAEAFYYAEAALMLDARSPEEYVAGHIAGARNLPWEQFDARMNEVMQDVGREDLIITYCDGDSCNLSQEVALALMDRGYTNVRVLVNGWTLWQENSLPVATGSKP
ncbi:rhodanese-like domain-containing protein [Desulfoferrobacter suflitae]|uniref:rhodanese-like domain-containing protein n=1 Tax=Desulfoferrobacter suflitae TaxID=2865782 RepID=UPI00216412A4|nr:rhodanese-like domain-containing protein [Desulfoferrobacter suflitae]MCK8601866.1 rhodanese-like domain-containing protein [Desulfoferrobacter suflitae]